MDQIKIGKFISELRKERNMTQREFAEVLGVSDKTISKWECGNGMPEVSIMPTLCSVLGITLNELFSGTRLSRDDYILKAEENIISLVQQAENVKNNIVGGQIIGSASDVDYCVDNIHCANTEFWDTIGSEFLGSTALPSYGGFTTEDRLGLLGDLHNKRTLEIGCGNGRSIKYVHDKGAKELWGIDISPKQLKRSKTFLSSQGIKAKLICVPMEKKGEIPNNYFD